MSAPDSMAIVEPGPVTNDGRQTWSARCGPCGTRIGGVSQERAQTWKHGHDTAARRYADDARDYRVLADQVIKWFNPPDDDVAEIAIHLDAIMRAGKFIEAQPCTCEDGAAEYLVDPCPRCQVLGRAADQPEER